MQASAEQQQQLLAAVQRWPMRNVRWMSIHLYLTVGDRGGSQECIKHWLLALLAQMSKLQSLKLYMREWFPGEQLALQKLKHLDARLMRHAVPQELVHIAALPCLETLRLLARSAPKVVEEWDLSTCQRLRAVSFVNFHVRKLLLPAAAALTVEGYSGDVVQYAEECIDKCRGLHVQFDVFPKHNHFWKSVFWWGTLHLLTALSLSEIPSGLFGTEQIHFGERVGCLRFLSLTTEKDANIRLSLPNLCTLALNVKGRLELEVDHLESRAALLDNMFVGWMTSNTVAGVRAVIERVCRQKLCFHDDIKKFADHDSPLGMQYMSFNEAPFGYVSHCHTASGACGACIVTQYGTSSPGLDRSGGLCCPHDDRSRWIKVHVGGYTERS